jgi:hypothetical protein
MSQQRAAALFTPPELYELATLCDRIVRPGSCEAFYRELAHDMGRAGPDPCSSSLAARDA